MDDFSCSRCGACCRWSGHVLLTNGDVTAMARHLALPENEFIQRYTVLAANRAQLSLAESADGACCFLEADNSCRVYTDRPRQCRDFPHAWRVAGCPASAPK